MTWAYAAHQLLDGRVAVQKRCTTISHQVKNLYKTHLAMLESLSPAELSRPPLETAAVPKPPRRPRAAPAAAVGARRPRQQRDASDASSDDEAADWAPSELEPVLSDLEGSDNNAGGSTTPLRTGGGPGDPDEPDDSSDEDADETPAEAMFKLYVCLRCWRMLPACL